MNNAINFDSFAKFIGACAILTREGIAFQAMQTGNAYIITITGY